MQNQEDKIAFSKSLQRAVLGHMMSSVSFCSKAKQHLKADYFITSELGDIFNAICDFSNQFSALAMPDPLADHMFSLYKKNYRTEIFDCAAISVQYPLKLITTGLTDWIRTGIFKVHYEQAKRYYDSQQSENVISVMKNFLDKAREVNLDSDNAYELGNCLGDFENSMSGASSDLTTGIAEFDDALGGGLMRGEHTLILAPTNVGKTTTVINFLVHNIKKSKHVLLVSHEGRPEDLVNRIRQRMIGKSREEIYEALRTKNKVIIEQLQDAERILQKYLCFVPHNKAGSLYIETVVDIVRIKNEQLFAKHGKYFDLFSDDYGGKLHSKEMKGFKEFRHGLKHVYDNFQQLALEFNMHAISPVQSNRTGFQQNAHRANDEMLDVGVIGESFGLGQDASNVISLNRSAEDRAKHIMHLHIAKTRQAATDITFTFNTDFSRGITHDESLGYQIKGQENLLQRQRVEAILGSRDAIQPTHKIETQEE